MRTMRELAVQFHTPEPAIGSFRTSDGHDANLFDSSHYPVRAVCRVCNEPIQADSFFRPFAHFEDDLLRS